MELGKRVAKNAKAIRLARGLSQQELAKKTRLTVRYISRMENTAPNLTLEVLERIIHGLGCSAIELIGDSADLAGEKVPTEALDETICFLQGLRSRL
jgi:transcriptional regulator with XRE-family HTH domain